MVLPQILLALVAPHFSLLPFGLQQFDVKILRPPRRRHAVHAADVAVLEQVLVRLLQLDGAAAHASSQRPTVCHINSKKWGMSLNWTGECEQGNYNALLFLVYAQLLGAADGALRFQSAFAGDRDHGRVAQHQTLVVGVTEIFVSVGTFLYGYSLREFYLIMYCMAAFRKSELMLRTLSVEQSVFTGLPLRYTIFESNVSNLFLPVTSVTSSSSSASPP